ncbi:MULTISPECIES: sigma-E factor negative regulatory protein [Ferrimonas]|uniref:sigma-E factor negative regulatory protein n=1 Tax=Ferrimonas TaxID=44011 RepID=UPI000401F77B|nr:MULTISPECIES: RseA family anti-sigma factor [Ferrimonas]USD38370.1 anti-sigma factor [Ferrimonas sp. SCSIO 43195]
MGTERKEAVSAWVDGQGSDRELEQWLNDEPMQQSWDRYHLIGDAMRNELPQQMDLNIAANVAAALEQEPTVLAPKSKTKRTQALQGKVVELSRRFGQYAIAATVAAIAVVGVQQYGAEQQNNPLPVLNTLPVMGAPTPASYQANTPSARQAQSTEQQAQEQRRRVNAYLRDHLLQQRLKGHNVADNDQGQQ